MTLEGHSGRVMSCAFSSDGTRVVTASGDKTARLRDAATGALQTTLEGHTESVLSCAFSGNDTCLVSASGDMTARLWDAATGALQITFEGTPAASRAARSRATALVL